jgi:hypothetical protein
MFRDGDREFLGRGGVLHDRAGGGAGRDGTLN